MRIAMLPLAFYPSKAYFNLVKSVDRCVFITDGKYAARRANRTQLAGGVYLTLPISKPGKNSITFDKISIWQNSGDWHKDMIEKIVRLYGSEFLDSNDIFRQIKKLPEYGDNLCSTLHELSHGVLKYMNIHTSTSVANEFAPSTLCGQDRAIQICKAVDATEFVQPTWSKRFFDQVAFKRQGIKLSFFKPISEDDLKISILDTCLGWWK